jgi:hypothetical protein
MSPLGAYAAALAGGVGVIAAVDLALHLSGVFADWPLYALLLANVSSYALVIMVSLSAKARAEARR